MKHTQALKNIILFDLDGTILQPDTQLLFCHWVLKQQPWRIILVFIYLLLLPLGLIIKTAGLKRLFLVYLAGIKQGQLEELVQSFCDHYIPRICYPTVLRRIQEHKLQGKTLILSSASPQWWVTIIGEKLGFDASFGTQVELKQGSLFPEIPQGNHKSERKIEVLNAYFAQQSLIKAGEPWQVAHAYSDSSADLPMLESAAQATLIHPSAKLQAYNQTHDKSWEQLFPKPHIKGVNLIIHNLLCLIGAGEGWYNDWKALLLDKIVPK